MRHTLIIVILSLVACRLMALPETQRDTCAEAVHRWHIERVNHINTLTTLPDEIRDEMIAFSALDELKQLKAICDIDRPPSQAARLP